ncbi:uncharacterized protein LOC125494828 [Beta vulgaris subsp. vulgaris]|uniref:uncharacterized protein LOC125494828 n=1 Tax=Beta vulgaris subsp. vulgaris TaxID=3555 RepID=UPI002036EF06|nr:uncharacterized protein LOC125494828 [Beta vulgaris subsp. vulgaris]
MQQPNRASCDSRPICMGINSNLRDQRVLGMSMRSERATLDQNEEKDQRDITSFFPKRNNTKSGNPSTPNSNRSQANLSPSINNPSTQETNNDPQNHETQAPNEQQRLIEVDATDLPQDPGKRKRIVDFHPDDKDNVRRVYGGRKLYQPENHEFPFRPFGQKNRRLNKKWFETYKSWLKYSIEKDAAFCFPCYLFKEPNEPGGDAFINEGFRAWNKTNAYEKHIAGHMSAHNKAVRSLKDFENQKANLPSLFADQSEENKIKYRERLQASIKCLKWLLLQGLPARGHKENETSSNRGNFLELLRFLASEKEDVA